MCTDTDTLCATATRQQKQKCHQKHKAHAIKKTTYTQNQYSGDTAFPIHWLHAKNACAPQEYTWLPKIDSIQNLIHNHFQAPNFRYINESFFLITQYILAQYDESYAFFHSHSL